MTQNFKYLPVARRFVRWKEAQRWASAGSSEAWRRMGAAFLQIDLGDLFRNTEDTYLSNNTIKDESDWPQIYSVAGQWLQTYSQCRQEPSSELKWWYGPETAIIWRDRNPFFFLMQHISTEDMRCRTAYQVPSKALKANGSYQILNFLLFAFFYV